jgi:glycosyltransferase involved in cell wall biosynthesis
LPAKKKKVIPSQTRLRDIAWEVGQNYPVAHSTDYISLLMITPGQGHVHWNVRERTMRSLIKKKKISAGKTQAVVRIHDVTDIIFDGSNSHRHFDVGVNNNEGHYSFGHDHPARHYIAELGFRSGDSFHAVARSEPVFFDHVQPSGNYSTAGLFSGGMLNRTFPVENIFDAPVYERMNHELSTINRKEALSIAVVNVHVNADTTSNSPVNTYIKNVTKGFEKFGSRSSIFTQKEKDALPVSEKSIFKSIGRVSEEIYNALAVSHKNNTFHLVHCHDWYSSLAGMDAKKKLHLPLLFSLHSTEHERTKAGKMPGLSKKICAIEKKAVQAADLVIVPHSSTRQQVTDIYDATPEKVVIIPDVMSDKRAEQARFSSEARQWFSIPEESRVVLFSGEMSHAAGADLIMEALPTVCRNHRTSHFILVGEGPLKGELEARAHHMGVSHRCRFPGHLSSKAFESVLMASDFVVIPARSWQDEGLARMAMDFGKPVLATHQSGVNCIEHGKNGLVTFDNPGSIVWGIQELLHNPLKDSMLRTAARKSAGQSPSLESISAQHYMYYEIVLSKHRGSKRD